MQIERNILKIYKSTLKKLCTYETTNYLQNMVVTTNRVSGRVGRCVVSCVTTLSFCFFLQELAYYLQCILKGGAEMRDANYCIVA